MKKPKFGDPARWADLDIIPPEAIAMYMAAARGRFYVYILAEPDGTPFYVGKGRANRLFQHEAEARNTTRMSHKLNLIRRLRREGEQVHYALHGFYDDEADAHAEERRLIAWYGRHDQRRGPLTNQLDGGEGSANPSAEVQARHAASLGGDAEDPERRAANQFLASIVGRQGSVPIKPWKTLRARAHLLRPSPRKPVCSPTLRMAKAVTAAVVAQELVLEEGLAIRRVFNHEGMVLAVENGCGGDMVSAGVMVPIEPRTTPETEQLRLTEFGLAEIRRWIGTDRLIDLGVLPP